MKYFPNVSILKRRFVIKIKYLMINKNYTTKFVIVLRKRISFLFEIIRIHSPPHSINLNFILFCWNAILHFSFWYLSPSVWSLFFTLDTSLPLAWLLCLYLVTRWCQLFAYNIFEPLLPWYKTWSNLQNTQKDCKKASYDCCVDERIDI